MYGALPSPQAKSIGQSLTNLMKEMDKRSRNNDGYTAVPHHDSIDGIEKQHLVLSKPKRKLACTAIIAIVLSTVAAILVIALDVSASFNQGPKAVHTIVKNPCGQTAEEAEARGCHFDVMVLGWLPKECQDNELTAEFMGVDNWRFWADEGGEEPIDIDTLSRVPTDRRSYTTRGFHIFHCVYILKKRYRASEAGRKVESTVASDHHVAHCMSIIQNRTVPYEAVGTKIEIDFPDC